MLAALVTGALVSGQEENPWPKLVAWEGEPLAGTARLQWEGDLAARMVDDADRCLEEGVPEQQGGQTQGALFH